jgi:hypothetical protein
MRAALGDVAGWRGRGSLRELGASSLKTSGPLRLHRMIKNRYFPRALAEAITRTGGRSAWLTAGASSAEIAT